MIGVFFEAISRFPHSLFFEEKSKKELKQLLQSGLGICAIFDYLYFIIKRLFKFHLKKYQKKQEIASVNLNLFQVRILICLNSPVDAMLK